MTLILDGRKVAETIYQHLRPLVHQLKRKGIIPGLAVVLINSDAESKIFVQQKVKEGQKLGLMVQVFHLSKQATADEMKRLLTELNHRTEIDGIVVQLPLPSHLDPEEILETVNQRKDVDGLTKNSPYPPPCASGILRILRFYKIDLRKQKIVIVGKGRLVGQPLLRLLQAKGRDVVAVTPFDQNFKTLLAQADLVIGGASKKGIISSEMVKKGVVIVDAAKNCQPEVRTKAKAITPPVGGVGPVTVATLLENVIYSAYKRAKISPTTL